MFNWAAINAQKNHSKMTFNNDISELFILKNIVENIFKISEIKLNLFENSDSEKKLKSNITSN